MGADFRGDPSSAMLEVLDPAQNDAFRDHYLDLTFDLSEVMFIATANTLDTIPPALLDRMEVIQLAGYTADEKLHIAKRYLVPRQLAENGLKRGAGSRSPTRRCGRSSTSTRARPGCGPSSARSAPSAASSPARSPRAGSRRRKQARKQKLSAKRVRELLGRRRVFAESRRRTKDPGVATGLAWTPVGGEVLFIEATAMPGSGRLTITGQLGEVMKESAQAALSWVRGHASPGQPRAARGLVRRARHPHPRARRGGPQGRPLGRRGDGDRARLAGQRPPGRQRRRDDRRDHADRPGAAGRRPEGEVAGRPARRDQAGDRPRPQRGRGRSRSPSTSAPSSSSSTSTGSSGHWRPRSTACRLAAGPAGNGRRCGYILSEAETLTKRRGLTMAKSTKAKRARTAVGNAG